MLRIRNSSVSDLTAIRSIHLDAFGDQEGPLVAQLAVELMSDKSAEPVYAFVAEVDGRIVGCVAFSSVVLIERRVLTASLLAPLAVASDSQRQGVGSALVQHGLSVLKEHGHDLLFVYGNPQYYSRFGFTAKHQAIPPYPLSYPAAWMACELTQGTLIASGGELTCAQTLRRPEYW